MAINTCDFCNNDAVVRYMINNLPGAESVACAVHKEEAEKRVDSYNQREIKNITKPVFTEKNGEAAQIGTITAASVKEKEVPIEDCLMTVDETVQLVNELSKAHHLSKKALSDQEAEKWANRLWDFLEPKVADLIHLIFMAIDPTVPVRNEEGKITGYKKNLTKAQWESGYELTPAEQQLADFEARYGENKTIKTEPVKAEKPVEEYTSGDLLGTGSGQLSKLAATGSNGQVICNGQWVDKNVFARYGLWDEDQYKEWISEAVFDAESELRETVKQLEKTRAALLDMERQLNDGF